MAQLERLAALREAGHLTDSEFQDQKARVLQTPTSQEAVSGAAPTAKPPLPAAKNVSAADPEYITRHRNKKTHLLLKVYMFIGIIPWALGAIASFRVFDILGGVVFLAFGLLYIVLAYVAWRLGDTFRLWARPDSLFVFGGIAQIAKAKLFWLVGPQSVAVLIAAGLCFYAFIFSVDLSEKIFGSKETNGSSAPMAAAAVSSAPEMPSSDLTAAAPDAAESGSVLSDASSSMATESRSESPTQPSPDNAPTREDTSTVTPGSDEQLGRAIHDALTLGRSVGWRSQSGQAFGYVSVSTTQQYSDRICRSYRYTVQSGSDTSPPRDGVACRVGAGDWALNGQPLAQ